MNEVVEIEAEVEETYEEAADPKAEIRIAFDEAVSGEKEEDEVKLGMIGAGATFKNVTRLYNEFMIEAGLAISKADRNQIIEDALECRDFETEADFDAAVELLGGTLPGATLRSASALVRAYAKKNELSVYSKPKSEGVARSGFANDYYNYLIGNPKMTQDEAKAFIMGEGDFAETSANVQKHMSHYLGIWKLVNTIATA